MSSSCAGAKRLFLAFANVVLLTKIMPALGACALPGHQPPSRGIPPVSFPCSEKQLEQMSLDTLEREQAACTAAAEKRGIDCGRHRWDELAEEQEELAAQLDEVAREVRRSWPAFKQGYVSACRLESVAQCSVDTLNLLKAVVDTRNPIPSPPNLVQNFLDGFAVGQCSVDVVTGFIDGSTCESRAQEVHSRILNYIIERKYEAEDRGDYYRELDDQTKSHPECHCHNGGMPANGDSEIIEDAADSGPPVS